MGRIPLIKDAIVEFGNHRFKIEKCIGRGNSSLVYKAEYIKAGVPVVLKEIYPVGLGIGRNSGNSSLIILEKSEGAFNFYRNNASNA